MYLQDKIYPLIKRKRPAHCTSPSGVPKFHIYKTFTNKAYYKVAIKRNNKYKARYFNTLEEARLFVEVVRHTNLF